jgi:hypothetical protein
MATLKFPFGAVDAQTILAAGTDGAKTINSNFTTITTGVLTGNVALAITVGAEVAAGAVIMLVAKMNGTETITFSSGIVGPVITGSAGKTVSQMFVYNGTKFYPAGAKIQVD